MLVIVVANGLSWVKRVGLSRSVWVEHDPISDLYLRWSHNESPQPMRTPSNVGQPV